MAARVAPCVLWIDEIEKALAGGGSGGDSTGTTRRLVGQFLYWLQESRAKVFVVATANDVSSLPPELLRKGRFDEIFSSTCRTLRTALRSSACITAHSCRWMSLRICSRNL